MLNLDTGFVSAIVAGMVVAFFCPFAISFAICKLWQRHKLSGRVASWFAVLSILSLCLALGYAFVPLLAMFVVVAFPLIFLGCYVGCSPAR